MATPSPGNEIERLSALIGEDDPLVRNILISASRNRWFGDSAIQLLYEYARRKGLDPSRNEPFYKYISSDDLAGPIRVVREKFHGLAVGLHERELSESMFIAGRPGTYKTAVLETICPQWVELGNRFFVISQKHDYISLIEAVPQVCVMDVSEFRFNPLEPCNPASANRHAQIVANAARKNFESMLSGEIHMYEAIHSLYERFGVYKGQMEFPTMQDLLDYEKNRYVSPHTEEARAQERLIRRLSLLTKSLGPTINVSRGIPIQVLLEHNIVLLVDRLVPQVRDFLTECILVSMFTYRIEHGERL